MHIASLRDERHAVVRRRVLDGVADLMRTGDEVTFGKVAAAAGVPERTVYRHFPSRQALLDAVFDWANERIGFSGDLPVDGPAAMALVRRVFPGFDEIASVVTQLLNTPEGRESRLANLPERQRAALALVRREAPGLDRRTSRRAAAAIQLLTTASSWQVLHDYWGMSGSEAGETAALAIESIVETIRARTTAPTP